MECSACQSQDLGPILGGVSKKSGKHWKGRKCNTCATMNWLPTGELQIPAVKSPLNPGGIEVLLKRQIEILIQIKNLLEKDKTNIEPEELAPDENVPF